MNDIALVYLANEVEWNTYVQPACLSNVSEDIKVGTQAKVAGWGINQGIKYISSLTYDIICLCI